MSRIPTVSEKEVKWPLIRESYEMLYQSDSCYS
jgi:hypothetical protein